MFSEDVDIKVEQREFAPGTVAGQFQILVTDEAGAQVFEYHADEEDLLDDWSDGTFSIAIDLPKAGKFKFEAWRKDAAGMVLVDLTGREAYAFDFRDIVEPQKVVIAVPVAINFRAPS